MLGNKQPDMSFVNEAFVVNSTALQGLLALPSSVAASLQDFTASLCANASFADVGCLQVWGAALD